MSKRNILVVASDIATEPDIDNAVRSLRLKPETHRIMSSARHGSIASIQNVVCNKGFEYAVVNAEDVLAWPDACVVVAGPDDDGMHKLSQDSETRDVKTAFFLAMGEFDRDKYR